MTRDKTLEIVGYKNAKHYVDANTNVDQALYDNEDMGMTAAIVIDDVLRVALQL